MYAWLLRLERVGLILSCVCCALMALLSFIDIVLRNLKVEFYLASEGNGILMGWMIFLALPLVSRAGSHISVDFLVKALPPRLRAAIAVLGEIAMVGYLAVLVWLCAELTFVTWQNGVRGQGILRVPMVYPQIGVLVGLAILLLTHLHLVFLRGSGRLAAEAVPASAGHH